MLVWPKQKVFWSTIFENILNILPMASYPRVRSTRYLGFFFFFFGPIALPYMLLSLLFLKANNGTESQYKIVIPAILSVYNFRWLKKNLFKEI